MYMVRGTGDIYNNVNECNEYWGWVQENVSDTIDFNFNLFV